jgi:RNA polymerase sigma-70 factor, ECF subfamily
MPRPEVENELARVETREFEAVVEKHHGSLYAFAWSLVRERPVAEDLVQDAFVTAYQKLGRTEPIRDYGLWLRGILRMKYLEWVRSRKTRPLDEAVLDTIEREHEKWDRASEDGRGDAVDALRQCLKGLEALLRQSVEMFYFRDLSCAEIATRLETSEAATKKRLQRARDSLADCVGVRLT